MPPSCPRNLEYYRASALAAQQTGFFVARQPLRRPLASAPPFDHVIDAVLQGTRSETDRDGECVVDCEDVVGAVALAPERELVGKALIANVLGAHIHDTRVLRRDVTSDRFDHCDKPIGRRGTS